jgi:hypothetical protein
MSGERQLGLFGDDDGPAVGAFGPRSAAETALPAPAEAPCCGGTDYLGIVPAEVPARVKAADTAGCAEDRRASDPLLSRLMSWETSRPEPFDDGELPEAPPGWLEKENIPDDFDHDVVGGPFHRCGWPGCPEEVPAMHWGCLRHTWCLPKEIRHEIWRTYVPGQDRTNVASPEHVAALLAAKAWVSKSLSNSGATS